MNPINMVEDYEFKPRDYAIYLALDGYISKENLITALLKYMSHEDVRDCLRANELSPEFILPGGWNDD